MIKMDQRNDFLQKNCFQNCFFLGDESQSTWLRRGLGPPILKVPTLFICSLKTLGQAFKWAIGLILSDWRPLEFFWHGPKNAKNLLVRYSNNYQMEVVSKRYLYGTGRHDTFWNVISLITHPVLSVLWHFNKKCPCGNNCQNLHSKCQRFVTWTYPIYLSRLGWTVDWCVMQL